MRCFFYRNTFQDDQAKYTKYGTMNFPNKKASLFTIVPISEGNSKKLVAQTVFCSRTLNFLTTWLFRKFPNQIEIGRHNKKTFTEVQMLG